MFGFGRNKVARVTPDQVMSALSKVQEPELHKDLVTLNMIRDLTIQDSVVNFTVMLTTPACPLRGQIERESREAVLAVPGVEKVNVKLDSNVPTDMRMTGALNIGVRNMIAVGSGKGGVGKSTVAVNLAVALAQMGAKVGLLDSDIYGPNDHIMLGLADHKPITRDGKIIPPVAHGVQIMSMGFLVTPDQAVIWRGPMVNNALRQFLTDVAWDKLDYLIIDLPPGTGDAQLSLAQAVPLTGAVVVSTPQKVAWSDSARGYQAFRKLSVPVLGLVENMSGEAFGRGGVHLAAEQLGVPFLGEIPMQANVREGGDDGCPVVVSDPDSPAGLALRDIAQKVAARVSVMNVEAQNSSKLPV